MYLDFCNCSAETTGIDSGAGEKPASFSISIPSQSNPAAEPHGSPAGLHCQAEKGRRTIVHWGILGLASLGSRTFRKKRGRLPREKRICPPQNLTGRKS